jgi:hypothetical protein
MQKTHEENDLTKKKDTANNRAKEKLVVIYMLDMQLRNNK